MYGNCFENRELSWLRFNERVLEEAEDDEVPLCERLGFLSIFQTNLDEFFRVRIGSLHDQMLINSDQRENKTNMTPGEQIGASIARIRDLCRRRDIAYAKLMNLLDRYGRKVIDFSRIDRSAGQRMKESFNTHFFPYLSTFYIGRKQPFPFLKNGEIYAVALIENKQGKKKTAIIPCSNMVFPRLVPVPDMSGCYVLSEEVILHFISDLFEGYNVIGKTLVRVTRNADIDADRIYDEELNYRDHMTAVIKQRNMLAPVRLELSRRIDDEIVALLCEKMSLPIDRVFEYDAPLEFSFVRQLNDELRGRSELFYPAQYPQNSPYISNGRSILDQLKEKDVLLHYPYESIRPFLSLLNEAAHDPRVYIIKMTLYRLAHESKVIESLVEAAENGKTVEVFVELKARFDEENNIEWSRMLERAGCKVIYGIEHIKVHSKLCLIGYSENGCDNWITQIGTGNYNEKTARLYTDICLMTADQRIAEEANMVFEALENGTMIEQAEHLLVSPNCMRNRIIDCIDAEIKKAREGKQSLIRLKMNSVTDKALIMKLIEASCAGVEVKMIVRGICCLIGGVPGYTERIHVISIVGRYLEHSRIYMFGFGNQPETYISSADFMTRNMNRRVEIACPVYNSALKDRIARIFDIMWNDDQQAREQQPDGTYLRRLRGENSFSCQERLYREACGNVFSANTNDHDISSTST